jgi:formylglycine-generating enzyme required for sulfatase activity
LKQFPADNISWDDSRGFIGKLNERERRNGYVYRLPMEAEWEYACRGGASAVEECSYHFYLARPTNTLSSHQANVDGNQPFGGAAKAPNLTRTTKVGSYPPNKVGLHDMNGNLWQWCQDFFDEGASGRVIRGGCWSSEGAHCRAAFRGRGVPKDKQNYHGFRLVRVPSGPQ